MSRCFEVSIPFLIILIPAIILSILGYSGINNQGVNNLVFLITSTHGAISAIMMLYLQKPYREFCCKLLSIVRHPKISVASTT
uniref:G_PROTEIN_RECEP_F1_2 domain-containing protein n=1 Tax=Caenorhabditis tropicalis TaxID=1561998 RepID=A0A1I7UBL2_9PELO